MSLGRLQHTIKDYRARLALEEQQAMQALEHAYAATLQLMQGRLDLLYQAIDIQMQSGGDVPVEWLYEQHRMETLTRFLGDQIDHFGALAQMQVGQLQSNAVQMGQEAAERLFWSTVPGWPNVDLPISFGMPSPDAIANLVGANQRGSPLNDLFQGFGAEAAAGVKDALLTGVSLGYNPRDIAPLVQQALDVPRWRALTIARTEMLRSYRGANLETFRANNDVVGGWIWQAAMDRSTCAACIAMNGSEHTLEESMDSHPNCRCVQVPKTKGWDDILGPLGIDTTGLEDTSIDIQSGADWFDGQSEATQQAILGPAKFAAFQNGDFDLEDVVGWSHDPDWGKSLYEKPLKELVK